jgi:hypothetical protein
MICSFPHFTRPQRPFSSREHKEKQMSLPFFSAHPSASPEEMWTAAFERLSQRIRHSFTRPETHQHALTYMQGLMGDVSRKNGWQVAEAMGEATPYAMQHLLDRAKWDCDEVRDALRAYIVETLATPNAVLVVDETGFRKVWLPLGGCTATIQRHGWPH